MLRFMISVFASLKINLVIQSWSTNGGSWLSSMKEEKSYRKNGTEHYRTDTSPTMAGLFGI